MTMRNAIDQARVDLAAALRQASRMGLGEGVCNHFSLAAPDRDGLFLINPQGIHWSEVRAADIVIIDGAGNVVDGPHFVEATAFFIHARIHRARPQAKCVLHTHMPYATALTLLEGGRLEPCSQTALKFYGRVGYDAEYNGLVLDDAEGDRIVSALGPADVLFLANHGVIVCAATVAWAFDDLYYLERACQAQVLALSTGGKLRPVRESVARATVAEMVSAEQRIQSELHFAALKRELDRIDPLWSSLDRPNAPVFKPQHRALPPLARLAWA